MRDLETIESRRDGQAETGHLVFGTLHTTGAVQRSTVSSMRFPRNQQEPNPTQFGRKT